MIAPSGAGRAAGLIHRVPLSALATAGRLAAGPLRAADPPAGVACLSDVTRAAAAQGRPPEDQRGRVTELAGSAERAAKAGDGAGCRRDADEALRITGLPSLAPVLLSTSMANEQRGAEAQVPAPPAPGASAGSTPGSSAPSAQAAPQAATPPAAPEPTPAPTPAAAPALAALSDAWLITARDLLGKRVVAPGASGDELGIIEDVVLEGAAGGRGRYVIIRRPGLLRTTLLPTVGSPRDVIVPLAALHFSARGDMARLDASPEKLRDAPGFQNSDLERLQHDQDWQSAIAAYYGVDAAPKPALQQPTPAAQPAAATQTAQADPAHGKSVAGRVCTACHSLDQGGQARVGPPLWGVDGRNIAAVQGFSYSGALRGKGGAWDDAKLDAFLKSPRGWAPGTRMAYPGISNDRDRADVVAYLNQLK